MGLFGKHKDNKELKKVDTQEEPASIELGEPISNQIIRDVQKHLHLGAKQEPPTLPLFISVSRIPNPENFVDFDILLAEVNQEDEEDRLAREAKENKEAEAKALKEKKEKEQLEANKQKQTTEEIPQEETIEEIELEELENQAIEDSQVLNSEIEPQVKETVTESEPIAEETTVQEIEENTTPEEVETPKEEVAEHLDENKEETNSNAVESEAPSENENIVNEQSEDIQEETASQEVEQSEPNKQESIENNTLDVSQEQERLAKEKKAEEKKKAEIAKKKGPTITSISASNLKGAKRGIVKASAVKKGGVSAAKEASDAIKEKEEEKKKQAAQARIEAKRALEKEAEMARLSAVSIIGTDKKPKPENGKFEIQWSNDNIKPYKLILKNDQGKVLYESTPIKTKPNELTATTFKNILSTGSFVFISTPIGYAFKILDSRMRVFHVSKAYRNAIDAQKLAAQIKKFGLSANYIDDLTKA